jgi:hypothetical protein
VVVTYFLTIFTTTASDGFLAVFSYEYDDVLTMDLSFEQPLQDRSKQDISEKENFRVVPHAMRHPGRWFCALQSAIEL